MRNKFKLGCNLLSYSVPRGLGPFSCHRCFPGAEAGCALQPSTGTALYLAINPCDKMCLKEKSSSRKEFPLLLVYSRNALCAQDAFAGFILDLMQEIGTVLLLRLILNTTRSRYGT